MKLIARLLLCAFAGIFGFRSGNRRERIATLILCGFSAILFLCSVFSIAGIGAEEQIVRLAGKVGLIG